MGKKEEAEPLFHAFFDGFPDRKTGMQPREAQPRHFFDRPRESQDKTLSILTVQKFRIRFGKLNDFVFKAIKKERKNDGCSGMILIEFD